jgi:hypothetical protein
MTFHLSEAWAKQEQKTASPRMDFYAGAAYVAGVVARILNSRVPASSPAGAVILDEFIRDVLAEAGEAKP